MASQNDEAHVEPIVEDAGPTLGEAAYHGIAGRFVRSRAEIRRFLRIIKKAGCPIEIRLLGGKRGIVSAYGDDDHLDGLADAITKRSLSVAGCYITLNPAIPEVQARADNRFVEYAKHTTTDKEIVRRCWLPIDCDAERASGISATADEHQTALDLAVRVRDALTKSGWPRPIYGDSGNGGHLVYRIDLPNDPASTALVKAVLAKLDKQFSTAAAAIDVTCYNAARIWKIPGTIARKGDSTLERPHRGAHLLDVPDELLVVPREMLEAYAAVGESASDSGAKSAKRSQQQRTRFDFNRFIAEHDIKIKRRDPYEGGERIILEQCVFDAMHVGTSAAIIQLANSALAYKCQHDGCADRKWQDVRELFEPGYRENASADFKAKATTKEPPRPLRRDIPPSEPYPVDAMGALMGNAALSIHDRVQAPIAICAQSVLAAANLAVQGHANIELPTGAIRPISIFLTTIAETGERKTTADDLALSAVKQREEELAREYDQEYPDHKNDLDVWEKQRSQILGDKREYPTRQDKRRALGEMGDAPNAPAPPLLTCPEPTFEGLTRLLREGALSVGVFSSEGGQFIGGHAMSEENRLKTAAGASSLWDGDPVKRVRQGDGHFILRGRRVNMHLLIQPGVANRFFGDEVLRDQGVLSRVLAVMPDTAAGTRFQREPNPENFSHLSSFSRGCLEFLKKPLPLAGTRTPELNPRILTMSEGARGLWGEFADAIEGQIGPGGALEPVRGLANKAPEHAARLAGTIELVADLHVAALSPDAMAKGIVLVQHYLGEALRIRTISTVQPHLELAARLLRWLQKDWPEPNRLVSLPDIYQRGLHAIRDQQTAARIVAILEQHGWLERVEGGAKVNGTLRRQVWEIIATEAET